MKNSYFCSDKVKYSGYGNPMWLKTKVNLFSVNWFKFMIIFHRTNCLRILNPYDVFGSLKSSILCYTQRSSLKIFYSKNKAKHHGKVLGWKVLIWWVKISKQTKKRQKNKTIISDWLLYALSGCFCLELRLVPKKLLSTIFRKRYNWCKIMFEGKHWNFQFLFGTRFNLDNFWWEI